MAENEKPQETGASESAAAEPAKKSPPKKEKAPGQNLVVKLKDIELPEDWNREKLVALPNLVRSIKEIGLITSLSVTPAKTPGKYTLVDGRRRYAALIENKIAEASVLILPEMPPGDAYLRALAANENREGNNAVELAKAFEKLSAEGHSQKNIANAIGKTEGYVSQHRAILKVPDAVQKHIRDGEIPPSATRLLGKLNYEEDQKAYDKVVEMLLSGTSLETVGESIELYIQAKNDKAESKGKKGSAAKTKAEKKRGPGIRVTDYADAEIFKKMAPAPKTKARDVLVTYAEKLTRVSSKTKSMYIQGILHGIELVYGLCDSDE